MPYLETNGYPIDQKTGLEVVGYVNRDRPKYALPGSGADWEDTPTAPPTSNGVSDTNGK